MSGLLNTMVAPDLYNLTMPATPPADLVMSPGDFVPAAFMSRNGGSSNVVGFDPRTAPYVRGLGLFANIADGLVSINPYLGVNTVSPQGLILRLSSYAFAATTGFITNTAGSANVTGTGFSQLSNGSTIWWRDDDNVLRTGTIETVTNDNAAVLDLATESTGMYTANSTVATWRLQITGLGSLDIPLAELNRTFAFSFAPYAASAVPAGALGVVVFASVVGNLSFSTISVNPLYAAKRLIFHAVAEIEHTFPQTFYL